VGCTFKQTCPHLGVDEGEHVPLIFQEEFMTLTMEISTTLPNVLLDNSNVDVELEVVGVESFDEDEPDQQDNEDDSEWDDLESYTEDEKTQIEYHSTDDDDSDDVEGETDNGNDY